MAASDSRRHALAPPGAARGHQRDSIRAAILEAATHLLARGGFTALTMRALARRIGVSAPTIYSHFRNKEALVENLVAQGLERLADALREARTGADGSRLGAVVGAYGRFAEENGALFDLMFPASAATRPSGVQAVAEEFRLAVSEERSLDFALATWALVQGAIALDRSGCLPAGTNRDSAIATMLEALVGHGAADSDPGQAP